MPTTSFIDVKFQEKVDKYVYENNEYSFGKGETVSMPRHTAFSFVNKQEIAKYASDPYDVKDEEYEDVLMRTRDEEKFSSEEHVAPEEWLDTRTVSEVKEDVEDFDDPEKFLDALSKFAERKGAQSAIDARIRELKSEE